MPNSVEGCTTNITTVEDVAEVIEAQAQSDNLVRADKEAMYLAVIGSLGAVIMLLICIIVCCAVRIYRIRRRPTEVYMYSCRHFLRLSERGWQVLIFSANY